MPESEVATSLLSRTRSELAGQFDLARPFQIEVAPGVLDVMGGIAADYSGAIACQLPIDREAAVLMQRREIDRDLQVFSFNLFEDHVPFTFRMPLDRLAGADEAKLAREFAEPGRCWAAHIAGCLYALHQEGLIDLRRVDLRGFNIATLSNIPKDAGLGAEVAMQAGMMKNVINHFGIAQQVDPVRIAQMCQAVGQRLAGAIEGVREPLTSLIGKGSELQCVRCQPAELLPSIQLPQGFRISAIYCGGASIDIKLRNQRARAATEMGHAMLLARMKEMGQAAGRELISDPMSGYLANLDQEDYKRFFRASLPRSIKGSEFLSRFQIRQSALAPIEPDLDYNVLGAVDHHVLEARRVRQFCGFIVQSSALPLENTQRFILMDKAGHLMYASHLSYMNDAGLGDDRCDGVVQAIRRREKAGLYGARMTSLGCGGTVAVLGEDNPRAMAAIEEAVASGFDSSRPGLIIKTTLT